MVHGPQAALNLVEALATNPSLDRYHLLPSVRADLLLKLKRHAEARTQFELAASLTQNTRERTLLLTRAAACQTQ
jgi:predicted RNA polymerase sigma factor